MNPCNMVFALFLTGLPRLNPVSTFILPLPVEIGTDIEFDMEISLPYTIIFPDAFGRRRRSLLPSEDEETDTIYGITVAKLNSMFESVGITDVHCQKRLICKIHNDPSKYSPLSDVILQHMDVRNGLKDVENHIPNSYMQFWDAGEAGLHPNGNCTKSTEKCLKDPDEAIDWTLMNFLQAVKHITKMKFK